MTGTATTLTLVRPLALSHRSAAVATATLPEPTTYAQPALTLAYPTVNRRPAERDELDVWAGSFVQAVVEVIAGDRPITQLVRWTSGRVYSEVARRQSRTLGGRSPASKGPRRQQLASVHVFRPNAQVAEVAARLDCGIRSRAIAARLDLVRDRWLCTTIQFG